MTTYKHTFLIAVPQLNDPNFSHSIVLMLEHEDAGALGLIINEATNLTLGSFAANRNWPCHQNLRDIPVFNGGPVEPEGGWLLHTDVQVPEKNEIIPGLYLSGSEDSLRYLLTQSNTDLKLVLGYAGWGESQLEEEITHGSWLSTDIHLKHIFAAQPAKIWENVIREMGIDPSQLVLGSTDIH